MGVKYNNLDKAQRDYVRSLPKSVRKLVISWIRRGIPMYNDMGVGDRERNAK